MLLYYLYLINLIIYILNSDLESNLDYVSDVLFTHDNLLSYKL